MPRAYTYSETDSSQVMEIAYDHPEEALYVRFRNTPSVRYKYDRVPSTQVTEIMFGKSIGSEMRKFTAARGTDFEKEDLTAKTDSPTFKPST